MLGFEQCLAFSAPRKIPVFLRIAYISIEFFPSKEVGTAIGTVVAIAARAVDMEGMAARITEDTDMDADTEAAAMAEGDITDIKEATETVEVAIESLEAGA